MKTGIKMKKDNIHSFSPHRLVAFVLTIAFSAFFRTDLCEAREVERSHRLSALRTATGGDASEGLYQDRLDATLDRSVDASKSVVARQDAAVQKERIDAQITAAEPLFITGFTERDEQAWDEGTQEDEPTVSSLVESQMRTSERQYQIEKREVFQQEAEKSQELSEQLKAGEGIPSPVEQSGLTPSLANNPFYFGHLDTRGAYDKDKVFAMNKSEIIERLIEDGYERVYASGLVYDAATADELMLQLMKDELYNFGNAEKIVYGHESRRYRDDVSSELISS